MNPSLSADGRFVAFDSIADGLVPDDTNGFVDVFVKDLLTGTITRVSTDANGNQAPDGGIGSSISADGRFVAFASSSPLVAGDTNGEVDIFVKDLHTGSVTRVSTDSTGGEANGRSQTAGHIISADGRHVVFFSEATNLVANDTNGEGDLFVKDLETGTTSRVSTDASGNQITGGFFDAGSASISADGQFVSFSSSSADLVPGDTNNAGDVFVKNISTGEISRVNTTSTGGESNGFFSQRARFSNDGNFVVFMSDASNLVIGDNNNNTDIFVKNLTSGEIKLVSRDSNGVIGNDYSSAPSISGDGRFIAFASGATNLVEDDTNATGDLFVRDMLTGTTTLVSSSASGEQANSWTGDSFLAANGRTVVFHSDASNLVVGDTNDSPDTFVKDLHALLSPDLDPGLSSAAMINESGELEIVDVNGLGANDDISLETANGQLIIRDRSGNSIGSNLGSALQVSPDEIRIGLQWFNGMLTIRSMAGDDTIHIGNLDGLQGGLVIEDGDGQDQIIQSGSVTLIGNAPLRYAADTIRLESGASITTGDGEIRISANLLSAGEGRFTGLRATNTTIQSASGNIILHGRGGNSGGANSGLQLKTVSILSAGGNVEIEGHGGGTSSGNDGVVITRDSSIHVGGSGNLSITGTGGTTALGSNNRGVLISRGFDASVIDGKLDINGTGANARSGNQGVNIRQATLTSGGMGEIRIIGTSLGSGSRNSGLIIDRSTASSNGTGAIILIGEGSVNSAGSRNDGIAMVSLSLSTLGAAVDISGNGGSGSSSNVGVRGNRVGIDSHSGSLNINGVSHGSTSGSSNRGIQLDRSMLKTTGDLGLTGTGGSGRSTNIGILLNTSLVDAAGNLTLNGTSQATTESSGNRGLFLRKSDLSGGNIAMTASGGGGRSSNDGFFASGSAFTATGGDISLVANAELSSTASRNSGASLHSTNLNATGNIEITGMAGSGTHWNTGVFLNRAEMQAGAAIDITGSARSGTTGNSNSGVEIRHSVLNGASVRLEGEGGGGRSHNYGLRSIRGEIVARSGTITMQGSADMDTNSSNNTGIYLCSTPLTADGGIHINGVSGGGKSNNHGVYLGNMTASAGSGDVTVTGDARVASEGSHNVGVYLVRTSLDGQNTEAIGMGGGGINHNHGLRMLGGTINSNEASGISRLIGISSSQTVGRNNIGVYISGRGVMGGSVTSIDGTGGGGLSSNHGVVVRSRSFLAPDVEVTGIPGEGDGSLATTGNFFS